MEKITGGGFKIKPSITQPNLWATRDGRIFTERMGQWIEKSYRWKYGYKLVRYNDHAEGRKIEYRVHRLMLEAWVGHCPKGCDGLHADDVKTNNTIENCYWGTKTQNLLDSYENKRKGRGKAVDPALKRLIADEVAKTSISAVARARGMNVGTVWSMVDWVKRNAA